MASPERTITEVLVEIRTYTIPATWMDTLDLDKLEPDERTVIAKSRKVFLDRKVRVSIESDPDS